MDEESIALEEVSRLELLEDGTTIHVEGNLSWFVERGYGDRRQDGRWCFSMVETLYLVKNNKTKVYKEGAPLGFNELLSTYIKIDGNVWRDYVIYMDLRKRRYVVKEGYSQKLRFRVFERGTYGEKPAKYVIIPLYEGESVGVEELLSLLKSCRAMNKTAVVAVLDRRNEVVYYQASLVDLRNK